MKRHSTAIVTGGAAGFIIALCIVAFSPQAAGQGGWQQTGNIPDPAGPIADMTVDNDGNLFVLTLTFGPPLQSRLFRSSDKGKTWETLPVQETLGAVTAIAADKSGRLWADSEKGFFRSEDNGETWNRISLPDEGATAPPPAAHIAISPAGGISLIRNDLLSLHFFISTDNGENWVSTQSDRAVPYASQSFYYLHNDGNFYVSASEGFLRYTYDPSGKSYLYDKSFSQGMIPIYHYVPVITGSYTTGKLFVASYNGVGTSMERLSASSTNGNTWRTLREITPGDQWETKGLVITEGDEMILITRTKGIVFSANQGQDWQEIGSGLPGGLAIGIYAEEENGALYAAEENGTTIFHTNRGASNVEESADDEANGEGLHIRCFPNPSDHALIEYTLPTPDAAQITICNSLGLPVRGLTQGPQEEGVHTLFWDGTDDRGLPLPNGVYIITLHGKGHTRVSALTTLLR